MGKSDWIRAFWLKMLAFLLAIALVLGFLLFGGGRSQGCTMWKMFSVKFNAYSSPEARRF